MQLYVSEIPEEGISVSFQGKEVSWEGLSGIDLEALPRGELFVEKKGKEVLKRFETVCLRGRNKAKH